jgi:formylglycine-generating enzyme required for sulfatase activity
MMLKFFLIMILSLILSERIYAQSSNKIAVLQLSNRGNLKEGEVSYLTAQLQGLVQQKTKDLYQVMTQDNILTLLPPNQTLENCIEGECEVNIGRLLGASLVVTSHIFRFGSQKTLRYTVKLHETQTGTLLSSQTIKAQKVDTLEINLSATVDALLNHGLNLKDQRTQIEKSNLKDQSKSPSQQNPSQQNPSQQNPSNKVSGEWIDWIFIQGGQFMMGDDAGVTFEKPAHLVEVKDFYISKTEITNAQYQKCMKAGICTPPHWDDEECYVSMDNHWSPGVVKSEFRGDNQPVICVEWAQARVFAKWVGGDLPSEAQWEYAARSRGNDKLYPWGNQKTTCQYAVVMDGHFGCWQMRTWDVCSFPEGHTAQGLCDVVGNASEWVLDEKHESYVGAPSDDQAWCQDPDCETPRTSLINRGGNWATIADQRLALTSRKSEVVGLLYDLHGFRVVKRIPYSYFQIQKEKNAP